MKLPVVAICGLTGAGKSTLAAVLEQAAVALRVTRETTRRPRLDDDPSLVRCVARIEAHPGDVVFGGWGDELYCLRASAVMEVRRKRCAPIVEVGEYRVAKEVVGAFAPGAVVMVVGASDPETIRALGKARSMSDGDIDRRIESIAEDRRELEIGQGEADFVLQNLGTVADFKMQTIRLIDALGIERRARS